MHSCKNKFSLFIFRSLSITACFCAAACVTNTTWDALIYPSESYYEILADDKEGLAICIALEAEGYLFDEFSVSESGIEITYPDNRQQRYSQFYSVNPVIITDINRDYDNPEIFSNDEFLRLEESAHKFCQDYQQAAIGLNINLSLSGILYWDYINGVRGGFQFSEHCEITGSYAWGMGSYANRYELNPDGVCPSGRVIY